MTAPVTLKDIRVAPMTRDFLLWRCLHDGPLDRCAQENPTYPGIDWPALRERNLALLDRLCHTYGSCAMLAWHDTRVVGFCRFYPRWLAHLPAAGGLCLQQRPPNGPTEGLVSLAWPALPDLQDPTLVVHCLMTGSPKQERNPYQRIGLASGLVTHLEDWARAQGWNAVEATAYADLAVIYGMTGQAGRRFWEQLGYQVVSAEPEPYFDLANGDGPDSNGFVGMLLEQAAQAQMDPKEATLRYTVRKAL